ncbi:unnamed protein product [Oppiella nova]|uniref:Protein kinase domain-containing protein n=1 Tax=Oppiella nova TaxID=334625 RepID=A0A7R9LD90_9ACAR|nr:unnamed protein product [Oppiella nova]CAG2162461.1 unnamed protein product [Oppiella nova]
MPLFGKKDQNRRQPQEYINTSANVEDVYTMKEILGTGAFSQVFLAQHKLQTNRMQAIKCIDRRALKGKEDSLENEIKVLRNLVNK